MLKKLKHIIGKKIKNFELRKYGNYLLKKINLVMNKYCINSQWFVDFGTLLGTIREEKFLKTDDDIDIGIVWIDNLNLIINNIISEFTNYKIKYCAWNGFLNNVTTYKFKFKHIFIEIHIYYEHNENLETYIHITNGQIKIDETTTKNIIYKLSYPKVSKIIIKKINKIFVPVPQNYDSFLSLKYGDNWMIKDKNWTFDNKAKNVEQMKEYGIRKKI